jgi:transcriptional regulator with XRE-family HTH domain
MIAPASPTVRRRRLAAELRGIRESKGKSGDAVAAALRWSPSKISRYERARTGLRPREVERLLDYYQITGARRTLLLELAEDAAQKGWWEEFADSLSDDYQQFIGLEHEATSIAIWHVDVVAGLLQTEAYAKHIISSYSRVEPVAPGMIGRMVRVRMQRQQVLSREGLQLLVVLDESVLKRRIGSESVMYEQLQRLAQEADRPNLTLRILPLDAQHMVFGESFVIFGFGDDSDAMLQDVVSTEQLKSGFTVEGERETYLHRIAFQMLAEASLDPVASRALILETAEAMWSDARQRAAFAPQVTPVSARSALRSYRSGSVPLIRSPGMAPGGWPAADRTPLRPPRRCGNDVVWCTSLWQRCRGVRPAGRPLRRHDYSNRNI